MGLAKREESRWFHLPQFLVQLSGIAVGLSLALAFLKLDVYTSLQWWQVLLPVIIALLLNFVVFCICVILWVRVAFLFFTGGIVAEEVVVDGEEFRLDVLFRTAKICFLGHGYVSLLMLSLGLFLVKLQHWPSLPVVYPLLPLIVLGAVYMVLAVMFQQPEVDPPWFFLVGISLMSQSVMMVIKLDHMAESSELPWAATFTPAWLTYVLLLIYCVVSPLRVFHQAKANEDSGNAGSADTPYGGAEGRTSPRASDSLHTQFVKVAGIGSWVIGWGLSQMMLTLRLDDLYKVSWLSITLSALVGWVLLLVFVTGLVTGYFRDITGLLMETFGLAFSQFRLHPHEEQDPFLARENLIPWR